jgi:hypothetical protein
MDALSAADIMQQAQEHAKSELTVNRPLLLGGAGLFYLLAYGIVWLAVRGQRPYQGPPGWTLGVLTGLVLVVVLMATATVNRAVSGVGGQSRRRRGIVVASLAAGQVAVWGIEGGLYAAGAGIGTVDLIAASGPLVVLGLASVASVYALPQSSGRQSSGRQRQQSGLGLGIWLIAAAVGSALAAAPATVWGIDALAACAGFLLAAVIESRPARP